VGVAYPKGITTIPDESLEACLGLKTIEGVQILEAFELVLGIAHALSAFVFRLLFSFPVFSICNPKCINARTHVNLFAAYEP
jgi:hypothetical protein